MWLKLFLILFSFGFGLKVNLIGTISYSEIFLLVYTVYILLFNQHIRYFKEYRVVTLLYFCLMVSQVISEIVVGNNVNNALKGIAITFVSFLHLIFMLNILLKGRHMLMWYLVGSLLRSLFLTNATQMEIVNSLNGEDASFLKIYIAHPVGDFMILLAVLFPSKKNILYIFMGVGILFVVLGARSSGGTWFIVGLLSWFLTTNQHIYKKFFYSLLVVISIVLSYGVYVVYVNQVLSGRIKSGNSNQLFRAENPYNPLNLLVLGRGETFVGFRAFLDRPLFGFGSWKQDENFHYHRLMAEMNETHFDRRVMGANVIPVHSVVIGYGVNNGFMAFVISVSIVLFFLRMNYKLIRMKDQYNIVLVYYFICIFWNSVFSPQSHFRLNLPIMFAFVFASWLCHKYAPQRALPRRRSSNTL